jgi:hypothetical protein
MTRASACFQSGLLFRGCAKFAVERTTLAGSPQIHRARIDRFRRIQETLDIDLTTPRGTAVRQAVVAGPNGCGKTTLLEAILLGLGMDSLIVRDLDRSGRDEHWRVTVPDGASITLDVMLDGILQTWVRTSDGLVIRDQHGVEVTKEPDTQPLAVEYFSSWRAPELVGAVKPLVGRGKRPSDTETNRLWRLKQRINDERARAGYQQALPEIPGVNKADQWLEMLNRAWRRFHGDDSTRIDAQIVDPNADELLADLFVLDGNGRRLCTVDQTSAGEIELLSFAGWVIVNGFNDGLLIIDEPELHLHPQWQATILPALRELAPEAQFIAASHSDAVWDQTTSYARFLLVGDDDSRSKAWRAAHPLPEQRARET